MLQFECNACHGLYDAIGADDSTYFHVCSAETWVLGELNNGNRVDRPLTSYAGQTLVPSQAAKDELVAAGANPNTIVIEIARSQKVREGHRNENTAGRTGQGGKDRVIKSEGAGRTPKPEAPGARRAARYAL